MLALIIIGLILAILLAILLIPVGVDLGYEQEELHLSAKLNGFTLQLIPKPPKSEEKEPRKKKPKRERKKAQAEGEEPQAEKKKPKLDFSKEELLALVKTALRGLGRFRKKLTVQRFLLHFTAAGKDPCDTAMLYGYVNAALSSLAPICAQRFTVRHSDVRTEVDFCAERIRLDFGLALTIRIGQILGVGLRVGFGALKILIRSKLRVRREAREAQKEAMRIQTEIEKNTIQEEERMAANG